MVDWIKIVLGASVFLLVYLWILSYLVDVGTKLTEYELSDIIIGISMSVVTGLVGISIILQVQKQKEQLKQKSKVDSALLIMELQKNIDTVANKRIRNIISITVDKNDEETYMIGPHDLDVELANPNDLKTYLNQFENIAIFYDDELLDKKHVIEYFGIDIKNIKCNTPIKNFIDECYIESNKTHYSKLKKLIKDMYE